MESDFMPELRGLVDCCSARREMHLYIYKMWERCCSLFDEHLYAGESSPLSLWKNNLFFKSATLSCSFTSCSWVVLVIVLPRGCCVVQFGDFRMKYKNCKNRYVLLIWIQTLFWQAIKWLVSLKLQCLVEVIFLILVCIPVFLYLSEIDGNIDGYFCLLCRYNFDWAITFVPCWNILEEVIKLLLFAEN